jgi:hypothetical protein
MWTNDRTSRRARMLCRLMAAAGLVIAVSTASGQAVYRCEIKGKVSYSHEPCAEAKAPGALPKQGSDTSRGVSRKADTPPQGVSVAPVPALNRPPAVSAFRCDGRLHCSQMTSCGEAKLFLRHCPGVKMDGDGDGVPCEQQWCTGD